MIKLGKSPKFIVGSESNRITAILVFGQLIDQIKRDGKGQGVAFMNGAASGLWQVCKKLIEEKKADQNPIMPGTGLIPLDLMKRQQIAVDDWLKDNMPNLKTTKPNRKQNEAGRAYGSGLNPGARVGGSQKMI